MYRFLLRPRWLAFHLLVVAAVIVMINLGFWQLRRLDERRDFNATVAARIDQPPAPLADVLAAPGFDPDGSEWLRVTATGTYLADQILVFNRTQGGRAGDNVLTPLALDDGRIVLVNRGFVPLGADVPAPPERPVEVLGRIRPSQERQRGDLTDADVEQITEIRRVEISRIAPQLPGDVVPVYLDLITAAPAIGAGDPQPVPPPELGEANHLSYAVQWFVFAACVAIGWALAIRRSAHSARRARDRAALTPDGAAGRTPAGSRTRDEAGSTTAPH